ncbi:MAG: hypothetical protein CK427_01725 [Leptospira sp.]|nr:MAG: hypothetical protein CK427_01725 [Leptospira sp.]
MRKAGKMKDKKFLLAPIIFLLILFLVDKIFLLEYFQTKFVQPGNAIFYHHRKVLMKRMLENPIVREHSKKIAIALGDSRAYPFSEPGLPNPEKEKWLIYNFASPQAVPMYAFMQYEKMVQAGFVPDMVYFSVSPEAFDDSKGMIYDPFMRLGMDDDFYNKYKDLIPWEDKYKYWLGKAFVFKSMQIEFKTFIDRFKSKRMQEYDPDFNEDMMVLNIGKGEYLGYATLSNNEKKLKKDAARIKGIYLSKFQLSNTQFIFVEKLLKLAEEKGTKVYLVWPRVYDDYRNAYYELNLDKTWWLKMKQLAEENQATAIDFNVESSCNFFNDASHQSIQCFLEEMQIILNRFNSSFSEKGLKK